MTASRILLLGLLAGTLLTGCAEEASGPIERQAREVGTFAAIEVEGAAKLDITVGSAASVEVEAPRQILDRITTEVRDDTLYVEAKPKDWLLAKGRNRVRLKVSVPTLASLRLGGGNHVIVRGFDGGESQIKVEGAAHIEAEGELDRLTVHMAGAGNGDFSRLIANEAHVTVDGVGNVVVHPKEKLDATMNGVGAIHYAGTPREVSTRMNGLGHIGKQDQSETPKSRDENVEIDPEKLQPEYEEEKPQAAGDVI
jgi:hypothetical protein